MHGWFAKNGVKVPLTVDECPTDLISTDLLLVNLDNRLCDFDIFERMLSELAPELLSEWNKSEKGVVTMNSIFAELQKRNYGPGNFIMHLSKMKLLEEGIDLLRNSHYSGVENFVFCGSNNIFATRVLSASKVWMYVNHIITNKGQFVHTESPKCTNETFNSFRLVVQDRAKGDFLLLNSQKRLKTVILVADTMEDVSTARMLVDKDIIFTSNVELVEELTNDEMVHAQIRFCEEGALLESVNHYIRRKKINDELAKQKERLKVDCLTQISTLKCK